MKNLRQQTVDVYNDKAQDMAEKFRAIPPRVKDIELALRLAGNPKKPRILEIGCGDGRDAKEIFARAGWFLGIDISEELIKLARLHEPRASFEVADAVEFDYPHNLDAVFAFASFLHLNKAEVKIIFDKLTQAMKSGGVIYLSLKYAPHYKSEVNTDKFGTRQYYFYNPELIKKLAGKN